MMECKIGDEIVDRFTLLIDRAGYVPEDENNLNGRWYKVWGVEKIYTDPIDEMDLEQVFRQIKRYMFKIEGEKELKEILYPEKDKGKCPNCGYDLN